MSEAACGGTHFAGCRCTTTTAHVPAAFSLRRWLCVFRCLSVSTAFLWLHFAQIVGAIAAWTISCSGSHSSCGRWTTPAAAAGAAGAEISKVLDCRLTKHSHDTWYMFLLQNGHFLVLQELSPQLPRERGVRRKSAAAPHHPGEFEGAGEGFLLRRRGVHCKPESGGISMLPLEWPQRRQAHHCKGP